MALLKPSERSLCEALSRLAFCNPFMPERIKLERRVLGDEFQEGWPYTRQAEWPLDFMNPNVLAIYGRVQELVETLRERLLSSGQATEWELALYEDIVLYHLYRPHRVEFDQAITEVLERPEKKIPTKLWSSFVREFDRYFVETGRRFPMAHPPAHLFACFFQIRRAFYQIYRNIVGNSLPAAHLRAAVWQSIFTHDLRRYGRALYEKMGEVSTLVTGPSGTGKELVARAIGLSRHIPFSGRKQEFAGDFAGSFFGTNLSALPSTLVESELFGHVKGAYTGAVSDRVGCLEKCEQFGTVFLDEVGELEPAIQVKLLRVLQERRFLRLGETTHRVRAFRGKIIAATNRDLHLEMRAGRFRGDLYFRLCGDTVHTPTLSEQLADSPEDLPNLIRFIAARVNEDEAESLAVEAELWIDEHLGRDYPWPGNFRELEQCVRNVMIRGEYHPVATRQPNDPREALAKAVVEGSLTSEELLAQYYTHVYAKASGNRKEAARHLGVDHRTVKSKIDHELFEKLRG